MCMYSRRRIFTLSEQESFENKPASTWQRSNITSACGLSAQYITGLLRPRACNDICHGPGLCNENQGAILKTISILGSGWLGFPLARHFIEAGYAVKTSTTSKNRMSELKSIGTHPFIVDIDSLTSNIKSFLQANILIVNIPSKNLAGFRCLVEKIEHSEIENVLFVSSTSVYENIKRTITESDTGYYSASPLLDIEALFTRRASERTTIVRFGGLIGYRRHPGRFFKPGRMVQNPDSPVNLIHRDDCIGIINRIVERKAWGEVLNCCADTHPTKREFYTRAAESIGAAPPEFGKSDSVAGKLVSNEKLKKRLNYKFKYPDLMKVQFDENP